MKTWVYDLEVYKNFFCGVFISDCGNETKTFSFHNKIDELQEMSDFIISKECGTLVGFNNESYDNIILNYVVDGFNVTNQKIYELSKSIIEKGQKTHNYWNLWRCEYYKSIDVFCIPKRERGLKERACQRHWYNIQDLPIDPELEVDEKDFNDLVRYCFNDVWITLSEYKDIIPLIEIRESLTEKFGVDVRSKHNAGVAEKIFGKLISDKLGVKVNALKEKTVKYTDINLRECIPDFIEFETESMKDLLLKLRTQTVDINKEFSRCININGVVLNFGKGGLHSNDTPKVLNSDDGTLLLDVDVTSYYPQIIINGNYEPANCKGHFIPIIKELTALRVDAKKRGDKVIADGLKIPLNSASGKFNDKYSVMFDTLAYLSMTITGQLAIIMLMESLSNAGHKVLSVNTDGVLLQIDRSKKKEVHEICKRWEEKTAFNLEYTPYKKFACRDINNYVALCENGEIKKKGIFYKGRSTPDIISEALVGFFVNDIPVKTTVNDCQDLRQFLSYRHISYSNQMTIDGEFIPEKTLRFYYSNNRNVMRKVRKLSDKEIARRKDKTVSETETKLTENFTIANKIDNFLIPIDLDRQHYIDNINSIINSIVPRKYKSIKHLTI